MYLIPKQIETSVIPSTHVLPPPLPPHPLAAAALLSRAVLDLVLPAFSDMISDGSLAPGTNRKHSIVLGTVDRSSTEPGLNFP